jgi:hypothetical protein
MGKPMIEGLVCGWLVGTAETREGKNASKFVVAKVKATTGDGETIAVNVIAFTIDACAALMALDDGDALSLCGSLTPKVWSDKQGNSRPALDMIASSVLTPYHASQKCSDIAHCELPP